MLMDTILDMSGYHGDAVPVMQKKMIDAAAQIPGVTAVGMINWAPLANGSWHDTDVFRDDATEFKQGDAFATPVLYQVSPGIFGGSGNAAFGGASVHLERQREDAAGGGD